MTSSACSRSTSRPQHATALGQATGSATGAGSLTLDVTDFPHAWYLRQVLAKVQERWQRQNRASEPDQKPLIWVEQRLRHRQPKVLLLPRERGLPAPGSHRLEPT